MKVQIYIAIFVMGFMIGEGAIRRTVYYLKKGNLYFKKNVKVLGLQWNPDDSGPSNSGLSYVLYLYRTYFMPYFSNAV